MRARLWSLAALVTLGACQGEPPRVGTSWANEARAVMSPATPGGEELPIYASYGPEAEREPLSSLDGEEDVGEVVVRLGEGIYRLRSPVLLHRAEAFVLQGAGPHKTRIELDTETRGSLMLVAPGRVELRDVTLVGYSGGGVRIKGCSDVVVENVHFAGLRFGLDLETSTASVGTSVFAGCQQGVLTQSGSLRVQSSMFASCWVGIDGRGAIEVTSSAFVENRDAIKARLDARSRILECLFAGEEQSLGWSGRPQTAARNLVHEMEIGKRVGRGTNRAILHAEEFPDALRQGAPPGFDVVPVHMAIERANLRGEKDPPLELQDVAVERSVKLAEACKVAALRGDMERAKQAAEQALAYLSATGVSLDDAPESVKRIAALAQ
jgi:hypothetical protein